MNSSVNVLTEGNDFSLEATEGISCLVAENKKKKEKLKATIFMTGVTAVSILAGFGTTLAGVRKQDPKSFNEGLVGTKGVTETGGQLALRALGWGTLYAFTGCGIFFYGVWKLSGASTLQEFRYKMGNILPKIPKNNPPQSRTEFDNLTDFLKYVSEDWGKSKKPITSD